ncbi:MAG: S41 family peptidase [Salinivirgaceae bacterium]
MKKIISLLGLVAIAIFFLSSCKKEKEDPQNQVVNQWIYDVMSEVYFWYSEIPDGMEPTGIEEPESYFNRLLYSTEDKWSFITDDYTGLMAEFEGTPKTMGFSPAFGQYYNSENVFMVVEYVYENSPAQKAGLKRGHIITKINNQQLTTSNYADLAYSDSYTVTLAEVSGNGIFDTNQKLTMTSEVLAINTIILDTVLNVIGQNIGYLVVSEFTSEEAFVQWASPVFKSFKSQNINNLIVDLRYNRGGEMQAAIWLASAIAPYTTTLNQQLFVTLKFNDQLQAYMDMNNESSYRFKTIANENLNLQTVYFLTTHYSTASASELVIVGLEPYMNVVQVGENTYGKYTGMWAIPDTEDVPRHNWGMLPIVMKYANANGKTDFKDGLMPDYYVEDDLMHAVPFGDKTDPQLGKAIELITGIAQPAGKKSLLATQGVAKIASPKQQLKSNLWLK